MLSVNDMVESILEVSINVSDQNKNKRAEKAASGGKSGVVYVHAFGLGLIKEASTIVIKTDRKRKRIGKVIAYVRFNAALAT